MTHSSSVMPLLFCEDRALGFVGFEVSVLVFGSALLTMPPIFVVLVVDVDDESVSVVERDDR